MLTTHRRPHVPSTSALSFRAQRRPLRAALLALSLGGLVGCDAGPEALDDEQDLDEARMSEALESVDGPVVDVAAHTYEEELTVAVRPPVLRAPRSESPEVCGLLRGPATIDADIDWSRSAGAKVSVQIGLERPDDAEVSLDVAVVVDGETMVELPGASILDPDTLASSAVAADRELRPFGVAMELDAAKLGLDLGALGSEHGMLVLVAKVRRGDGEVEVATRPLFLFFSAGEAGVELVDEATGFARGLGRSAMSLEPAVPELGGAPENDTVGEGVFKAAATEPQALDLDLVVYVSAKLCARHSVTYTDSGIAGEDYWTTSTAARRMTGADARVYASGQQIWSGKLGDGTSGDGNGEGCTPFLWMPAGSVAAMFYDTDTGSINGNFLKVRVHGGSAPSTFLGFSAISQSGTYTQTGVNTSSVYPAYLAIAKAMRAHSGGGAGITYSALTEHSNGSRYDRASEEIRIAAGDAAQKFITVHEYGHAFGDKVGDSYLVGGNCNRTSSDSDCSSGGSHGMTSIEWQSCAVNEGFAHFIAADTFNNHAQDDCRFRYWGSNHGSRNVDCEGSSSHVTAWMENMCESEALGGAGVELDWLRQFWDVHTNSGTTNMIPLMAWIRESDGWTAQTAYDELDAAAQAVGGSIRDNWNAGKSWNGVDY